MACLDALTDGARTLAPVRSGATYDSDARVRDGHGQGRELERDEAAVP